MGTERGQTAGLFFSYPWCKQLKSRGGGACMGFLQDQFREGAQACRQKGVSHNFVIKHHNVGADQSEGWECIS